MDPRTWAKVTKRPVSAVLFMVIIPYSQGAGNSEYTYIDKKYHFRHNAQFSHPAFAKGTKIRRQKPGKGFFLAGLLGLFGYCKPCPQDSIFLCLCPIRNANDDKTAALLHAVCGILLFHIPANRAAFTSYHIHGICIPADTVGQSPPGPLSGPVQPAFWPSPPPPGQQSNPGYSGCLCAQYALSSDHE